MSMGPPAEKVGTSHFCKGCEVCLDASAFYWKGQYKHSSYCRGCYQISRRAYQQKYMKNYTKPPYDPDKREESRIKSYGLTLKDYDDVLARQSGACAICGSSDPKTPRGGRFCVDHNHKTGEIRGLLCANCNRGIGLLGDSSEMLLTACAYLKNKNC